MECTGLEGFHRHWYHDGHCGRGSDRLGFNEGLYYEPVTVGRTSAHKEVETLRVMQEVQTLKYNCNGGISAGKEVEEKSGDSSGVASEPDPQMRSNCKSVEDTRPLKDQTNQRTEVGNRAQEERASSSGSEQVREAALFSPGFSSAAAKAGWDAETLLMAALSRSPVDSGTGHDTLIASQVTCVDARKRDKKTPLSSARRHRRFRLENKNGSPLGRLPMKPLTLLSDNELENIAPTNENSGPISVAEGKENCNHYSLTCKSELKAKEKEQTPTKPLCLDQLREELSCAVCLDVCFEPSTISCGHSFCGTCLQSVLQKCGPRCPKCRQPLRSEALRNYPVNTVLWNTIQILFPKESAARIQDKKLSLAKEAAANKALTEEHQSGRYLGTRPSRMQPWRSSAINNVSRTSFIGNLRNSFQAASELMMPSGREREDQHDPPILVNREDGERSGRSRSRSRRQIQATQELIDAALAARLQQAELNAASDGENLLVVEEIAGRSRIPSHPTMRSRTGTITSAAVNLRAVASRATRQRRARPRS